MFQPLIEYNEDGFNLLLTTLTSKNYSFEVSFSNMAKGDRKVFLRHDVDVSLEMAKKMAEMEAKFRIKSAFFIMVNSPFYNIFERKELKRLRSLSEQGSTIGLHANIAKTDNQQEIEKEIQFQREILELAIDKPVSLVSFHHPTLNEQNYQIKDESMRNIYNMNTYKIRYFSDSNRQLDFARLHSSINARENIQLLLHPVWWLYKVEHPSEVWEKLILNRSNEMRSIVQATERTFRKNMVENKDVSK